MCCAQGRVGSVVEKGGAEEDEEDVDKGCCGGGEHESQCCCLKPDGRVFVSWEKEMANWNWFQVGGGGNSEFQLTVAASKPVSSLLLLFSPGRDFLPDLTPCEPVAGMHMVAYAV